MDQRLSLLKSHVSTDWTPIDGAMLLSAVRFKTFVFLREVVGFFNIDAILG